MRYEIAHSLGRLEAVATTGPGDTDMVVGWPMLTGGESEVAWALRLRRDAITAIRERLGVRPGSERRAAAAALWTEVALRHTDARWWITHHDDLPAVLQGELTGHDRQRLHRIHQAATPTPTPAPPRARAAADGAPVLRPL